MRQQTWDGSRPAQIENIKRQSLGISTQILDKDIEPTSFTVAVFILAFKSLA